jgi:hypothetical protein
MAWIRLSDDYNDHPKFQVLSDGAFRLWHQAMGFCRKFQTDGQILTATVKQFKAYSPKRMAELKTPWKDGEHPLWHESPSGIAVHDYLDWNLSKADENQQREEARQRVALGRDMGLRSAIRERDQNKCRYCGRVVNWSDRRGPCGATYDHVIPRGGDELSNLVISCRGCNSKKGKRTPDEAGMSLLDVSNSVSRSDLSDSGSGSGLGKVLCVQERESERKPNARSKRPIFTGQRMTIFEWMLDDCTRTLGPLAAEFDLHEWFFALDAQAAGTGMVIPQRDGGAWLQSQLVAEAQRRGLPVASAVPQAGKLTTRLAAACANIRAEEAARS